MFLLAALSVAHAADDFGVTLSLAGGWYFTDPLENLDQTWSGVPRLGYNLTRNFIIEAESGYHQGKTRAFGNRYDMLTPRLNLLVVATPEFPVHPFISVGGGAYWVRVSRDANTWSEDPFQGENIGNYVNPDTDAVFNAGPGLMIPLAGALSLRLDARYILTIGQEPHGNQEDVFNNFEVTAGFVFRQAERNRDTDLDGILDRDDACVEEPEDRDTFEDTDGCPDVDNDQDGILDVDDDCMHDAEDFDEFEDWDGCPEFDNDHDGFDDYEDDCPYKAEDRDGYRDGDGCPELDNDGDGIADLNDRCPNHPEDLDGFEDNDGCEDTDNDSDGHPDVVDACENEPETWNGFEDRDGCPDDTPDEVQRFTGVIRGINFEVNSDRITVDSYQVLNEAADVLLRYPDLKIEVQGHTDSDGSVDFNFELSDRRAAAVVAYLVDRGVPAERLTWMGYGESRPLVENTNDEGKAINRRVEFHVVEAH